MSRPIRALIFAAIYVGLSIGLEAALIVVLHWKVPQDNGRIAPIILTVPPVLAALMVCGRRRGRFIFLAAVTVGLTLAITIGVNRLTGVSTGLAEPLANRGLAGFLAAMIMGRGKHN
jgi:hypothetical protein